MKLIWKNLLPTFIWFVFTIEKFVFLNVSSYWKCNCIHFTSGNWRLYSLCNKISCSYRLICPVISYRHLMIYHQKCWIWMAYQLVIRCMLRPISHNTLFFWFSGFCFIFYIFLGCKKNLQLKWAITHDAKKW